MQKDASARGALKSVSFLSRVSTQGRNYSNLVAWLLYTVFKGRTRTLALAIVLNLVHLASQAAAIYVIYWYAKEMEGNGVATVPYLKVSVNLKDQPELLWAVVFVSMLCFVLSATLLYFSKQLVLNIAEKNYGQSLERLVLMALDLPDPRVGVANRLVIDFGVGGLATGARRGALIATAFANAIAAVIGAIGATFFLIRVDLPLTLLILVSAGLAAFLLYPLTLRAVRSARAREKAQIAFKRESRQVFENRNSTEAVRSMPTAAELARAFLMRRRVLTELVFAIEIGVTIILSVVIYYMASQAFSGREQWAIFIAYIGALRIALSGCSAAIQAFASVSRFYPAIVRYYLFIKEVEKMHATPLATLQHGDTVILGPLPSGADVMVKAGQRVALVTADPVQKVMFALLQARSPQSTLPVGVTVVDSVGVSSNGGAIALVYLSQLEDVEARLKSLDDVLNDKVVLVTYSQAEKIGSCGEEDLLTIADGELRRFVRLGTSEADAAIKEIAALAKRRSAYEDDDEEENE